MNHLKDRRNELGLSQTEVVDFLRGICPVMDVSLYSKIENGHCLPNEDTLTALESHLQARRSDLFPVGDILTICAENAPETLPEANKEDSVIPPCVALLAETIPFGRRNAIPREKLARKLRVSDRKMRQEIETARRHGLIILCEQDGRGYWQSSDIEEMRYQYRQDTNRALSILRRRKPLRDALKAAGQHV